MRPPGRAMGIACGAAAALIALAGLLVFVARPNPERAPRKASIQVAPISTLRPPADRP